MYKWCANLAAKSCAILFQQGVRKKRVAPKDHSEHERANPYNMYSHTAQKRATQEGHTCTLFLQSDTILWEYFTGKGDDQLNYVSVAFQ